MEFNSNILIFFFAVPAEKMVIYKERASGWYRLSAYYLAKMTSELPLILLQPLLFLTVVYWVVGLNGAASYFATIGTIFVHSIAGQVNRDFFMYDSLFVTKQFPVRCKALLVSSADL